MRVNEFAHHAYAFRIVDHDDAYPVLLKKFLGSLEVSVFSNNDAGNAEQQCGASAHDAGTESADQRQLRPVAAAAGISQAYGFRMRRGIAALYP